VNKRDEILKKINRLSGLEIFLDTLLHLCDKNLNSSLEDLSTRDMKAILNINELSLLFGFWLKNKHKKSDSILSIKKLGEKVHSLMDELHWTFMIDYNSTKSSYSESMLNASMLQETIFYSGTGAYDYQYVKFIEEEYKYDKDWIQTNKNIDITRFLDFYSFFKGVLNFRINYTKQTKDHSNIFKYSKDSFIFKKYPEFQNLIKSFSINKNEVLNQNFSNIGELNEFSIRPIIEFESYYLIPIPFLLAEALNKSPYYWFLDDKNYRDKALHNRGKASEEMVFDILNNAYNGAVFKNVLVKPNKTKTITDIDVCLVDNETMIIFQIKSKKLTQLSKQGNLNQIKKDYKGAVTDAYQQAVIAYEPILSMNCDLVDTNNQSLIDGSKIKDIYTVCIVLDNYPPLTSHTIMFNEEKEVTPVAISVFDLEVCVEYLQNKSKFVDYIKRRTLHSKYYHAETELSFLQYHLQFKLEPKKNSDKMMLDNNFAQQFDKNYYIKLIRKYEAKLSFLIDGIEADDFCFCGSGNVFNSCCKKIISRP